MSRLIYPVTFEDQQTLFAAILAKNTELGAKSPLLPFTKIQKIDLVKLEGAIKPAAEQNTASGGLRRDSENDTQQRDATFALPWEHLLSEVQFLKHLYAGMERELGEWGVTVDAHARIVYPTDVVAEATLIQTFLQHHLSFAPGESPLQTYINEHDIDVNADLAAAGDVVNKNTEHDATTGDSELATQQRDKIWAPVVKAIHLIGAYLMNLYHEDSRKMAAWGFVVVEDAAGERVQMSTIDPGTQKTITSVAIPGTLTNIGTGTLQVTRGKGAKAVTSALEPGKTMGMVKGLVRL